MNNPFQTVSYKKKLRVGFDFDGVITYHPLGSVRPLVALLKKKKIIRREQLKFFQPKNLWQNIFWLLFHQVSSFPSLGVGQMKKMIKTGLIKPYLITGRNQFLKSDLLFKLKLFGLIKLFESIDVAPDNYQPHLHKLEKIINHKLDYYIEDNWDIVDFLHQQCQLKNIMCQVLWISNCADRHIEYKYKFGSLIEAIKMIDDQINQNEN